MPARKLSSEQTDRLTVTLDAAHRAEIERLAQEEDRSLAWVVREALSEYLAKSRDRKAGGQKAE